MRISIGAACMAAVLAGGCAINNLGAGFTVYEGGDIVLVERRAAGAQLRTDEGLGLTLGESVTRVAVPRALFEASCGARPDCAFHAIDALFVHRDVTGLDMQAGGLITGVTLGRSSLAFKSASQSTVAEVYAFRYDSEHPERIGGCVGWDSCELYLR